MLDDRRSFNRSCSNQAASLLRLLSLICLLSLGAAGIARAADAPPLSLHSRVSAPSNLKLEGAVRARYETLSGQVRPGFDASDELLNFRTNILIEYKKGVFRIGGELFDSRAYLGDTGSAVSTNEVNALEIVQAYVAADFTNVFGSDAAASVQAGRYTANLGSRRLVAADDYRNTMNGFTGLKLDVKSPRAGSGTFIYALPQRKLPEDLPSLLDNDIEMDEESSNLVLWGGVVTTPKFADGTALNVGYLRLHERDSGDLATRNRQLGTSTLRWFRDPAPGRWDFELEGAYQDGSIRASTSPMAREADVSAYFYRVRLGYQWNTGWKPRVYAEYDYVSGDESGSPDYERYDTLFGFRRPDYAPSGIYATVGRANIRSPGVRVEIAPTSRLEAFVGYRALWLESRTDSFSTSGVRDASGQSGRFAGHQLDSRLRYWIVPRSLRFEANLVLLDKGRFLNDAPNAPRTGDASYFSINLTASF
jgi:hypothetical protein